MDGTAKWTIAMIALTVAVLIAVVVASSKSATPTPGQPFTSDQAALLAVRADDHGRGNGDGKAILIEYGDFQCPACATYEPMLHQLLAEHDNDVRFIFRHYPLQQHANAEIMARASEAADKQGKFWELHDAIYAKQTEWSTSADARSMAKGYARDLGLDVDKFDSDLFDRGVTERISRDKQDASALAVQGTPSFFLDGKALPTPKSYDDLVQAVQEAGK